MSTRTIGVIAIGALWGALMLSCASASATVYGWKGEGQVWHLSNDPADVPETQRSSVRQFTSKFAKLTSADAPSMVTPSTTTTPPAVAETSLVNAYERGLEQGLHSAERQVELAGELAQTILSAVPRTPPTRIVIQQPGPVIIHSRTPDYYPPPFYSYVRPYFSAPCASSRFIPHSHFFPGPRSRGVGVFFPQGHFSHHGFLCGFPFSSW